MPWVEFVWCVEERRCVEGSRLWERVWDNGDTEDGEGDVFDDLFFKVEYRNSIQFDVYNNISPNSPGRRGQRLKNLFLSRVIHCG